MDMWYLISLVTHLNWPGFIENFLASCRLQQFQVTRHRRIPSKIKARMFTSCFNKANDRAKSDYWGGRKTLLLFLVYGLMTCIETIEVFPNNHLGSTDQKNVYFDQLRHWQKTDVNRGLLIDSSNLLSNYFWITCWEISK